MKTKLQKSITIDVELYEALKKQAKIEGRNFSNLVEVACRKMFLSPKTELSAFRVKVTPSGSDEAFMGTVVAEEPRYYIVVPDENIWLAENWDKRYCEVIF